MGILPLEFSKGESADSHKLTGKEQFSIEVDPSSLKVNQTFSVKTSNGATFNVRSRLDTDVEIEYYKNGGILHYVLRKLLK